MISNRFVCCSAPEATTSRHRRFHPAPPSRHGENVSRTRRGSAVRALFRDNQRIEKPSYGTTGLTGTIIFGRFMQLHSISCANTSGMAFV
jgi:hypothetical protein